MTARCGGADSGYSPFGIISAVVSGVFTFGILPAAVGTGIPLFEAGDGERTGGRPGGWLPHLLLPLHPPEIFSLVKTGWIDRELGQTACIGINIFNLPDHLIARFIGADLDKIDDGIPFLIG